MALTAGDILTMARTTALDPAPGKLFTDAQGLSYLNSFIRWAIGLKPDLSTALEFVTLVAGSNQQIPTGGMQFLDARWTMAAGKAVFMMDLESVKHTRFSDIGSMTPTTDPVLACADPRDPTRFQVFPPADGSSDAAMMVLYSTLPATLTVTSDPYPLNGSTFDSAYRYVLSLAYARTTTRQDLDKAAQYLAQAQAWFGLRNQAQFGEAPQPDA